MFLIYLPIQSFIWNLSLSLFFLSSFLFFSRSYVVEAGLNCVAQAAFELGSSLSMPSAMI